MRGPIDFIIVGFEGNKFDGSILRTLTDALDSGVIGLVDLAIIGKDSEGNVILVDMPSPTLAFVAQYASGSHISQEDIDEMAELLENNATAALLVIEQLWAKPLKQAIIDANGVLVAEGRIHPEAAEELTKV